MPRTVLVIDDNALIRVLASRLLSEARLMPSSAPDGPSGLRQLDTQPFDLVIVDLVMPEMWGDEFVRRVRIHKDPAVRRMLVLGLSGSHEDADAMFAAAGASAWIRKPLHDEHLLSAVRRLLGEGEPVGQGCKAL